MNPLKQLLILYLSLSAFVLRAQKSECKLIRDKHGRLFNGYAAFKFMIATDSLAVWSNDGSVSKAEQPMSAVKLYVSDGEYVAELGMMPMKPIFQEVMKMYDNLRLFTWIDTGEGFVELGEVTIVQHKYIDFDDPTSY